MTNNTFFDISKQIANEYLQSIIFIDDEVYAAQTDQDHRLSQEEITRYFSEEEKICAVYNPKSESELSKLKSISKKADIVVLDWNIQLISIETAEDTNDEDDVEDVDPRGVHTINMIKDILYDKNEKTNGLKVLVVYTGETGLSEHRDRIFNVINSFDSNIEKEGDFNIIGNSYKIVVISKESTSKKHISEELKARIISYAGLPEYVLNEFTSLTNGILSNFALKSLSEIRKNSSKLLSLFSKELDPAYLSHQALISNKEDANELLVELIKDAFGNILKYRQVNKLISDEFVKSWLHENIDEKDKPILKVDGSALNKNYTRNIEFLISILNISKGTNKEILEEYRKLMNDKSVSSYITNNNITFFSDLSNKKLEEINKEFAILSHHKNLYSPMSYVPVLSLGTVVNSKRGYYVCVQQRCDSVRVMDGEERRFLFIPLTEIEEGKPFHLVTPDGINLKVDNKSYSLRTIKFSGDQDGLVKGIEIDGQFCFKQKYQEEEDEIFNWVFDLKDLHAQRIISNYSSQLSRVGLDESEWLRRWST
ncbi:response regulator receiver domain [Maribacter stanieri]|uniref:response regulator receiver domain n=1 Tax=Maribacter stanieri TaxID=440514 RepID=UPI0030DC9FD6|tara:strand:- start:313 stop:1929 length:1617 start_codon:yes stop_codon:yes gene_type:complete